MSFKQILRRIGQFQSAALLSLFYLLLWMPLGFISRFCADWLHRRPPQGTHWWPRPARVNDSRHVEEPF